MRLLPNADVSSWRLKPSCGWPLNQNGAPAASTEPAIVCATGVMIGSFRDRRPGRSTVWKPFGTNRTLSPTWIRFGIPEREQPAAPIIGAHQDDVERGQCDERRADQIAVIQSGGKDHQADDHSSSDTAVP